MSQLRTRGQRGLGRASLHLLERAAEIAALHGPISVRGVAYKLFVGGEIESMEKKNVDRVGHILVYGREHNEVDWSDIVDESRAADRPAQWDNLAEFGESIVHWYRLDRWASQDTTVQVWSEKATVGGIIRPITRAYGVSFMAVHGFGSATVVYDTAMASLEDRREVVILYVGDHDPSGMHMSEVDLPARLARYGGKITIRRIALTTDDLPGLPSFAAKEKDPRFKWYRSQYGEKAWELDALDPGILRARVEAAILDYIDPAAWERAQVVEEAQMASVRQVADVMADLDTAAD